MLKATRADGVDWFDGMFRDPFLNEWKAISPMRTDIKESDNKYTLYVDLPGYHKEDIKMGLKGGYLIISAENLENLEEKEDSGKYVRRERHCGQCSRRFYIGSAFVWEDVKGFFADGTLRIEIPKKEEERKYISIE